MDEYRCPIHGIVAISIDDTVPFECRKCGGRIGVSRRDGSHRRIRAISRIRAGHPPST
jgi:DNA-directed RNA polymerase subunit RPC12/RpoP